MSEDLYELPKGWVWTGLKIVCEKIQDGSHFSPQLQYTEGGEGRYLYITAKNIKPNGLDLSDVTYVDETFHKSIYERCNPEKGDVLLTKDGVKTGVVTLNTLDEQFSLLSSVALFKTNKLVLCSNYLRYFLSSPVGFKMITGQMTGTAIKRIVLDKIRQSYICLPPLPEQHRIVAKIEELFTELDAGVELLKKLKAKLKRYRQAVLKAAVEGNLTKEWREANQGKLEPASMLRDRILKQRREKWEAEQLAKMKAQGKTPKDDSWKLKYKEPIAPDTSDLPELPNGWCWATLDQISVKITDGEHLRPKVVEKGVYFLSAKDIREEGVNFDEPLFVSEDDAEKFRNRCDPEKGDILIVSRGATVGRSCLVNTDTMFCLLGSVILIKLYPYVLNQFAIYSIKSPDIQKHIINLSGSTAQQAIYIRDIRKAYIPLPSLEEQHQIFNEVERCLSVIHQLEKTIDTNLKRAEKLRQSILKQAFEGKLVPQDPNDEPAEKLLERIKAEKAKHEVEKKPKRQSKTKSSQPRKSQATAIQLELNFDE
ncbi:MAG TPA: restriction endonuclease subunit S [Kamptonema sp.]|nr:restriction endonuclease subunit S [Kamptonema sp.]